MTEVVVLFFLFVLLVIGLTTRYTFCDKCGQKRWHKVTLGRAKDDHKNIKYETETCSCWTCGHIKWVDERRIKD